MKNYDNYISAIFNGKKDTTQLTYEELVTRVILSINRTKIEIQDLEQLIVNKKDNNVFSLLILGTQFEIIKKEIIKIKQDYLKK